MLVGLFEGGKKGLKGLKVGAAGAAGSTAQSAKHATRVAECKDDASLRGSARLLGHCAARL